MKCKACNLLEVKPNDSLCVQCRWKIDMIDQRASDIDGIREDMRRSGIPLNVKGIMIKEINHELD